MKVNLTVAETKTYTFEMPNKFFKQLENPTRRCALLEELYKYWYHSDDFCDEYYEDVTFNHCTDEEGLNILHNISAEELDFFSNKFHSPKSLADRP